MPTLPTDSSCVAPDAADQRVLRDRRDDVQQRSRAAPLPCPLRRVRGADRHRYWRSPGRPTADPGAAEQCVSTGVTQHSSRIVSAYQTYAAAPAPAPMVRLQKAFIAMHQTQLWCLTALGKPGKR